MTVTSSRSIYLAFVFLFVVVGLQARSEKFGKEETLTLLCQPQGQLPDDLKSRLESRYAGSVRRLRDFFRAFLGDPLGGTNQLLTDVYHTTRVYRYFDKRTFDSFIENNRDRGSEDFIRKYIEAPLSEDEMKEQVYMKVSESVARACEISSVVFSEYRECVDDLNVPYQATDSKEFCDNLQPYLDQLPAAVDKEFTTIPFDKLK